MYAHAQLLSIFRHPFHRPPTYDCQTINGSAWMTSTVFLEVFRGKTSAGAYTARAEPKYA